MEQAVLEEFLSLCSFEMSGITQPTAHLNKTEGTWILSNTAREPQISLKILKKDQQTKIVNTLKKIKILFSMRTFIWNICLC